MRRSNHEAGYMLVGVLLAITVLAIVGTSLVTLSVNSVKTSSSERDNQAVYYIAEAGLTYLESEFEKAVAEIYDSDKIKTEEDFFNQLNKLDFVPERYDTFEKVQDSQPFAELEVEKITEEKGSYKLISTGNLYGENRRVSQIIQVGWNDKYEEVEEKPITSIVNTPPFAVFTRGQFTMTNGTINGDIGTLNDKLNGISFPGGGPTVNGKIYVPNGNEKIVNSVDYLDHKIEAIDTSYHMPSLPPFPDEFPESPEIPENYTIPGDEIYTKNQYEQTYYIKDKNLLIDNYLLKDFTLNINKNLEFNKIYVNSGNDSFTMNLGNINRGIITNTVETNKNTIIKNNVKFDLYAKDNIKTNANFTIEGKNSENTIVAKNLNINNGEMKLQGNTSLYISDTLTMNSNSKLIFGEGDNNLLVVDNLNLVNGNIDIEGSGKLTIYVRNRLKMVGRNINKETKIKDLEIFYAGSSKPEFGGDTKIYGNLYAKQADLEFGAGNGIQGTVLSGGNSIKITGGSANIAQMFFAPNAHVEFSGGGKLKGKVIANRFTISGGGTVDFTAPDIDDDLFNPNLPDDSVVNGPGASEIIETGASPSFTKGKVREESK